MSPSDNKTKKKKKSKKKVVNTEQTGTAENSQSLSADQAPPVENVEGEAEESGDSEHEVEENDVKPTAASTNTSIDEDTAPDIVNGVSVEHSQDEGKEATTRFDALINERDALRAEVGRLRQSLEELQDKHEKEVEDVQGQLRDVQSEKEQAEENYQNLLGKVNTIRSQLGERLKADAEELTQTRTRIDELEEQKSELQEQYTVRSAEVEELSVKNQEQAKELSVLRNRANLSQQNWQKEREELVEAETYMREEFENAKQAMHDWEVLAMEERTIRKDLADKVADFEEQLTSLRDAHEKATSERDTQSNTVDGLRRALQEIQTVRKQELKELVENSQAEMESMRKQLQELQKESQQANAELESTKKDLERATPFEKEVKEKNLLIGKLRHEAVILNDHLTKALRFLKKGKPEDNVDRQIVTNHFLHFLALDRSDPKKFQVLQLIAALLGWTDEQREQAGLSRPGTASSFGSLRLPGSSLVHRTPSTPALSSDYSSDSVISPGGKESLAELWQNFLEQEAGSSQRGTKSRQDSLSTVSSTPKA